MPANFRKTVFKKGAIKRGRQTWPKMGEKLDRTASEELNML